MFRKKALGAMLPKFKKRRLAATLLERKKMGVSLHLFAGEQNNLSILNRIINFPWDMWSVVDLEVICRFKIILPGGATQGAWLCSECRHHDFIGVEIQRRHLW